MRKVNFKKPKKPLKIYDDSLNLIAPEEDQISKITELFDHLFLSDGTVTSEETILVTPEKMEPPFTPEEIQKASKKLKDNKAAEPDLNMDRINYL